MKRRPKNAFQKTAPDDVRHDRVDRSRRTEDEAGAVRAGSGRTGPHALGRDWHDRRPRQVHGSPHLRQGVSGPLLPDGDGRAAAVRRGLGLAAEGFMPFATTYAVFASRRAYDFIHQTIAEEDRNVKIVCALPGLTSGYGPSHQATEDLALFPGDAEHDC